MNFHSPLSNEGIGEFVSRADPSSAAIGQREEVGEMQGNFCISLCIQVVYETITQPVPSVCAKYWLSPFGVVGIHVTTRIFCQTWRSNRLFKSHHCDDDTRGFKRRERGLFTKL